MSRSHRREPLAPPPRLGVPAAHELPLSSKTTLRYPACDTGISPLPRCSASSGESTGGMLEEDGACFSGSRDAPALPLSCSPEWSAGMRAPKWCSLPGNFSGTSLAGSCPECTMEQHLPVDSLLWSHTGHFPVQASYADFQQVPQQDTSPKMTYPNPPEEDFLASCASTAPQWIS